MSAPSLVEFQLLTWIHPCGSQFVQHFA